VLVLDSDGESPAPPGFCSCDVGICRSARLAPCAEEIRAVDDAHFIHRKGALGALKPPKSWMRMMVSARVPAN